MLQQKKTYLTLLLMLDRRAVLSYGYRDVIGQSLLEEAILTNSRFKCTIRFWTHVATTIMLHWCRLPVGKDDDHGDG